MSPRIEHNETRIHFRVQSVFIRGLPCLSRWSINHPEAGIPGFTLASSRPRLGPSWLPSGLILRPKTAKNTGNTRCSTCEEKTSAQNAPICTKPLKRSRKS